MYEAPQIRLLGSVTELTTTPHDPNPNGNNSGGNQSGKANSYLNDGHQYHPEFTPGITS